MPDLFPFQELQKQIAAFVRDPEHAKIPPEVNGERLSLYRDIIFCGILEKITSAFPVCHSIMGEKQWPVLVRDFFRQLKSASPWFHEIPKDFVEYLLEEQNQIPVPAFLPELAHYEWMELALELADIDIDETQIDAKGDLLESHPVVSPLAWILQYQYPVHKIGIDFMPDGVPETPTFLILSRNKRHKIDFIEISGLTTHLLHLLIQDELMTGLTALNTLYQNTHGKDQAEFIRNGSGNLKLLKKQSIILGTRKPDYG